MRKAVHQGCGELQVHHVQVVSVLHGPLQVPTSFLYGAAEEHFQLLPAACLHLQHCVQVVSVQTVLALIIIPLRGQSSKLRFARI